MLFNAPNWHLKELEPIGPRARYSPIIRTGPMAFAASDRTGAERMSSSSIYDRRVSDPNQLIHNRRRALGAAQMRPDRGQRNL
jgi:hypothetical protein